MIHAILYKSLHPDGKKNNGRLGKDDFEITVLWMFDCSDVSRLPCKHILVLQLVLPDEAAAEYDPGEVSQVEHVVRLVRRGQQVRDGRLVHFHGRLDHVLTHGHKVHSAFNALKRGKIRQNLSTY